MPPFKIQNIMDSNKIVTNKMLASLMLPSVSKLLMKLYGTTPIILSDEEIKTAMLGIKCECKARIESIPNCSEEYKRQQEQYLENIVHWMEESFLLANAAERQMQNV